MSIEFNSTAVIYSDRAILAISAHEARIRLDVLATQHGVYAGARHIKSGGAPTRLNAFRLSPRLSSARLSGAAQFDSLIGANGKTDARLIAPLDEL